MQFKLAKPVFADREHNRYYVEVTVMFGDADGFETFDVGPFNPMEEHALADLIETLRRVGADRPRHEDGYQHVEGFRAWFDDDYEGVAGDTHWLIRNNVDNLNYNWWPMDRYAPYPGKLDKYQVVWYDSYGFKFNVDIVD